MNRAISVQLWGQDVGTIFLTDRDSYSFVYSDEWINIGIELSPLVMPLGRDVYRFPNLNRDTYYGLPGLIADSLPDKFGNSVIDAYMQQNGISPLSVTSLQRLAYVGRHAMGAMEFEPADKASHNGEHYKEPLAMRDIVESARRIINSEFTEVRSEFFGIGSLAGGARAKAVIGYNPQTCNIVSGQLDVPEGYTHYLIKLDGTDGSHGVYGRRESAYLSMARAAGIQTPDHFLFEDDGQAHLMVKRFDRTESGEKVHMQSLCGLAYLDFNQRMVTEYSTFLRIIRQLNMGADSLEEAARRMAFNVLGVNRDDHTKNQSFLMDRDGRWSLSPAYDLAFAWNEAPDSWTHQHQMLVNGKARGITRQDMRDAVKQVDIRPARMDEIIDQVDAALAEWPRFAEGAGMSGDDMALIQSKQQEARRAALGEHHKPRLRGLHFP